MRHGLSVFCVAAAIAAAGCHSGTSTPSSPNPNPPGGAAGPGALTPENTKIEWTGTKPGGKHDGGFAQFSGTITSPNRDAASTTVSVEIDIDSLTSDDSKLTNHLKSPDFFDAKKYPKATFRSTAIKEAAAGTYEVTGDLTLHGTTKPITFPAKVTVEGDKLSLDSTFTFDRTEYGITFDPSKVDPIVTVRLKGTVPTK
jgi:polyisoprenoid-binding protein YceI